MTEPFPHHLCAGAAAQISTLTFDLYNLSQRDGMPAAAKEDLLAATALVGQAGIRLGQAFAASKSEAAP